MTAWANSGVSPGSGSVDVTEKYRGMSLAQAEDAIRKITDHEEAVIFDKEMNVIAAYSGQSGSVGLPSDLKKKQGITVTHNHPTGRSGYGATFSPADVMWFFQSRATEFRAVASGKGEYVYSLSVRGKQSSVSTRYAKNQLGLWAAKIRKDALPVSNGGTGKLQSDYRSLYREFRSQGKSERSARHAAWQMATGKLERSLTNVVGGIGSYGVVYYARNRSYNVNR